MRLRRHRAQGGFLQPERLRRVGVALLVHLHGEHFECVRIGSVLERGEHLRARRLGQEPGIHWVHAGRRLRPRRSGLRLRSEQRLRAPELDGALCEGRRGERIALVRAVRREREEARRVLLRRERR